MLTFCQWFIFYYLSYFLLYQRLEILETDNTLQNDLTDKDIHPLADNDQILLYNVSYRKPEHLIRKEFVCGVVLKNS